MSSSSNDIILFVLFVFINLFAVIIEGYFFWMFFRDANIIPYQSWDPKRRFFT